MTHPERRWRQECSCRVAVRAQTRGAVVLVMAGHVRKAEGRHVPEGAYPTRKGDRPSPAYHHG
jgi:hypothetical protein